jgi:hypothetical protein
MMPASCIRSCGGVPVDVLLNRNGVFRTARNLHPTFRMLKALRTTAHLRTEPANGV